MSNNEQKAELEDTWISQSVLSRHHHHVADDADKDASLADWACFRERGLYDIF